MERGPNQLKIACWNSRGFSAAMPYLRKLLKENDVVAIAEHWLHDNRLSLLEDVASDIRVHGRASNFAKADNYGTKRGQGGVALLWKSNLIGVTEISNIIHDRICGIRIATQDGGVLNVFSVYMPAQGCGEDLDVCLDDLAEILSSMEQGSTNVVCGDFNADMGSKGGPRSRREATKQGKSLYRLVNEFGYVASNLMPLTTGPVSTYIGPNGHSTIDYILVPQALELNVTACQVYRYDAINTSDHQPVQIVLNIEGLKRNTQNKQTTSIKRWDKLTNTQIQELYASPLNLNTRQLVATLSDPELTEHDLDQCIEDFVGKMKSASHKIPSSKFRKHIKPYWNSSLSDLKKAKVTSYRKWVEGNRPRDEGNVLRIAYKHSKKLFRAELKRLSKNYEDDQIAQAVKAAEIDRGQFWKLVKKSRKGGGGKIASIKRKDGKVVSDIDSILEVWKTHFEKLYAPKFDEEYDQKHYDEVTKKVADLNNGAESGHFLQQVFTEKEIETAVKCLHKRKACGYDGISTEHLAYGGRCVIRILTLIYNHMLRLEYIPVNLRRGIQIPLFKGKGACCLEPDNYRGISLLTNLNKVYEVLVWGRLKDWWNEQGVISDLQGAGKKKLSCVHTALLLQESVACALETNRRVFVTYLDVSKAYDTVWIDGLFFKLHKMGIDGKLWRLMYRTYLNFKSRVRIEDKSSEWFSMRCGIHQGGFLSLTKYVAFINNLLQSLKQSKLCCTIGIIPSTPVGYADDVATANTSKTKTDKTLQLVHDFGLKWRFSFNAKKSAILVYGETKKEHEIGSKFRTFRLGRDKVGERSEYDHVGIKACIFKDDNQRIEEKLSKGRRTLNAASGLGIRKNGLTLKTCNLIFWTIVIPTVTFGCEIWSVGDSDLEKLQCFQRYAGRRVQRFPKRSPNSSSYYGLGWVRIETFIQVKKLLFILTYLSMDENSTQRRVFNSRVRNYVEGANPTNPHCSPIFEILDTSVRFDLLNAILNMAFGHTAISAKKVWSKLVWDRAWRLDDIYWKSTTILHGNNDILTKTIGKAQYLSWWFLADNAPLLQGTCETMARLVCHASRLKCDDPRLKKESFSQKICGECTLGITETVYHMVMQCPVNENNRKLMFTEIRLHDIQFDERSASAPGEAFYWLMGKHIPDIEIDNMCKIWAISGRYIANMYHFRLKQKEGIG